MLLLSNNESTLGNGEGSQCKAEPYLVDLFLATFGVGSNTLVLAHPIIDQP